ncbi:MAG: NAD(P)-dependent oxidoreductase [Cyanobacteriota bacterium]|nr:NAD(P)-dependent oxidoreductase [Cyanobacteriota bacterium]
MTSAKPKRILITGGTGFFGRAILKSMQASPWPDAQISILSREPSQFLERYPSFANIGQVELIKGDIQVRQSLPWGQAYTHILHAATDSTHGPSLSPMQRYKQIVAGTENILELAVSAGAERFLLTSSGGIYGPQPADLASFREDWLGGPSLSDPNSAYSQGKRAAEHLCALFRHAHGLPISIARCFAFIGPDLPLDAHFAIGNFIRDALSADVITVAGDGTPLRTYLDQSDLAHWLRTLLLEGKDGETYNVGSDEVVSMAQLAHLVRDLIAPAKAVRILGRPEPSAARQRYVPNIEKARELHGLSVSIPLADAIRTTAQAHQQSS